MLDYRHIGRTIRHYRQLRGLTQEELAFSINSSPVYISNIERAVKKPSLEKLYSISNALNITINQIISPDENQSSDITAVLLSSLFNNLDNTDTEIQSFLRDLIKNIEKNS